LLAEDRGIALSVWVKTISFAALPGSLVLGVGNVPVGSALFGYSAEVLTKVFEGGASKESISVVDLEDDEAWLEHNCVGNHGIVGWIGVFGDVEIFLYATTGVGEKCPVCADSGSVFVGLGDVVGADGDETAVAYLHLAMELDEELRLTAIFGAKASTAQDEHHGVLSL
jgi:hypothetical protein